MPRAIDPQSVFDVVLDSDQHKPAEEQPAFIYRALNGREWRRMAAVADKSEQGFKDSTEMVDMIFDHLKIGLVGWKNMVGFDGTVIEFNPDGLLDLLDPIEAMELMTKVIQGCKVSQTDKKKSDSQPSSDQDSSANTAQQPSASTVQVSESLPRSSVPNVEAVAVKSANNGAIIG